MEVLTRAKSTKVKGVHGFKRKRELLQIYGCIDKVEKIIAKKRQSGQWRRDPELPDDPEEDGCGPYMAVFGEVLFRACSLWNTVCSNIGWR